MTHSKTLGGEMTPEHMLEVIKDKDPVLSQYCSIDDGKLGFYFEFSSGEGEPGKYAWDALCSFSDWFRANGFDTKNTDSDEDSAWGDIIKTEGLANDE